MVVSAATILDILYVLDQGILFFYERKIDIFDNHDCTNV